MTNTNSKPEAIADEDLDTMVGGGQFIDHTVTFIDTPDARTKRPEAPKPFGQFLDHTVTF